MQDSLPLASAAAQIARFAVPFDLFDVPAYRFPSPDLSSVFLGHPTAHVIAAIPLKPTARVIRVNPSLRTPDGQWLAGVNPEQVE
jgi:hypothetical protein